MSNVVGRVAVDAPQPAGGHHADARRPGRSRAWPRRSSRRRAPGDGRRQVAPARLEERPRAGDPLQLLGRQADPDPRRRSRRSSPGPPRRRARPPRPRGPSPGSRARAAPARSGSTPAPPRPAPRPRASADLAGDPGLCPHHRPLAGVIEFTRTQGSPWNGRIPRRKSSLHSIARASNFEHNWRRRSSRMSIMPWIDGSSDRATSMRVILDVLQGPRKGRSFVFDRHDTFIVGRSRFVHCPMPEDSALSRDHFLIEINPPRCEIRDLGSTNGTFVNDRRVERFAAQARATGSRRARASSGSGSRAARRPVDERRRRAVVDRPDGRARPRTASRSAAPVAARRRRPTSTWPAAPTPALGEPVDWLCEPCRAELATLPQPVPHYTTLRELGRGAMGVVYQARHNQTGQTGRAEADRPRDAPRRGRPSIASSARCRSSAS